MTPDKVNNMLDTTWGQMDGVAMTHRDIYRIAVDVAQPLIQDEMADEATEEDLRLAYEVLNTMPSTVVVPEAHLVALHRCVDEGVQYMAANDYSNDESFPETAFACRILTGDGTRSGENVRDLLNWPSRWS